MSIMMVLKIFSDCCICFAILASRPISFEVPLLFPALLWGVIAGIATFFERKGWKVLRCLCGFLPFLCLLFGKNDGQILLLAVPAIYTAAIILRGKLELEYYSYQRFFKQSLMLLGGVYLVVNIWKFLTMMTGEQATLMDTGIILKYSLVHAVCGIVLQRQLRLGADQISKSNRRQMSALLGAGGVIVFGFLTAEPLLRMQVLELVKIALLALGVPIVFLIELISKGLTGVGQLLPSKPGQIGQGGGTGSGGEGAVKPPEIGVIPGDPEPVAKELDPMLICGALVAVLLIVAAIILYRSFQKQRNAVAVGELTGLVVAPPKKKRSSALSNRQRVRQLYREFLRTENGRGLKLKKNDTSADVLKRIHPETDKESAQKLRQVYLSARYDDRNNVSRGQLNAAKQALKGTKR